MYEFPKDNSSLSIKLREKFCKDCGLPIKLYQEPYFSNRLKLCDYIFNSLSKWNVFLESLSKYDSPEMFLEDHGKVSQKMIDSISSSEGYIHFNNSEDMNKFRVKNTEYPSRDIFKETNDGRTFVSLDMSTANFSALRAYDMNIFDEAKDYYDWVSRFTSNEHFRRSKYMRQVIFGNCNPKRQVTYEKHLMDTLIDKLTPFIKDHIVSFVSDEIVIDATLFSQNDSRNFSIFIDSLKSELEFPISVEVFELRKIKGVDGFVKVFFDYPYDYEFKCVSNYDYPFVLRAYSNERISEYDKIFYHEGRLAIFIDTPTIIVE